MLAALRKILRKKWLLLLLTLTLGAVLGVVALERNLTQVVLTLAQAQARALAVQVLNEAAADLLSEGVA